jgi:hypothetical protein
MMLALTLVTGVVDAVSYLRLGHVFVANMTGNVVFLGFAIAGAVGLSAALRSRRSQRSCSARSPEGGSARAFRRIGGTRCARRRPPRRC